MNWRSPTPGAPIRWSPGTRQPSKISSRVSVASQPIFPRLRPSRNPGVPRSTMNAEYSRPPSARAPLTARRTTPWLISVPAFEVNILVPSMTQPSPSRRAVVWMPRASDPAAGSVSPKAPSFSPRASGTSHRCF